MYLQKIFFILIALWLTPGLQAHKHTKIYVSRPGTLADLVTNEKAKKITHLNLQGKLNAVDFQYLRDTFANLQFLNLSAATISRYAGKKGTFPEHFHIYRANSIPPYAFCTKVNDSTFVGKSSLRHIILPVNVKSIEEAAFKHCNNLSICQIRIDTPPDLHEDALSDSITAIFVPTGKSDAYRDAKNWGEFAFIEGKPTRCHIKIGERGSLASELIQNSIRPKDVNFLMIEGKMDEADFTLIRNYMPNLVAINLEKCNATVIPDYTFTHKKYLLKITFPSKLKIIGQRAFSGCIRLHGTLVLPPSVTSIEYGAFIGCKNLHRVVVTGNQLTTLGDNLFGKNDEDKLSYQKQEE